MTALLQIAQLRGGYGRVEVLRGIDLHVDAGEVVEIEQVSEVHSTSGQYDLLVKCHLADETDPGRFVCETIQRLDGIADTYTLVGYKAF